jgi:hypothetical protein
MMAENSFKLISDPKPELQEAYGTAGKINDKTNRQTNK